jgi:hypothetical protein
MPIHPAHRARNEQRDRRAAPFRRKSGELVDLASPSGGLILAGRAEAKLTGRRVFGVNEPEGSHICSRGRRPSARNPLRFMDFRHTLRRFLTVQKLTIEPRFNGHKFLF